MLGALWLGIHVFFGRPFQKNFIMTPGILGSQFPKIWVPGFFITTCFTFVLEILFFFLELFHFSFFSKIYSKSHIKMPKLFFLVFKIIAWHVLKFEPSWFWEFGLRVGGSWIHVFFRGIHWWVFAWCFIFYENLKYSALHREITVFVKCVVFVQFFVKIQYVRKQCYFP